MKNFFAVVICIVAWSYAASAQTTLAQYGSVTLGHPAIWLGDNSLADGGPPEGGPTGSSLLTGLGVTNANPQAICANSGPYDQNFAQICMGFSSGIPQITLSGTPAPTALQFLINGVTYSFPGAACLTCGTMATQNANNVSISGGVISGVTLSNENFFGGTFSAPSIVNGTITGSTLTNVTIASEIQTTSPVTSTGAIVPVIPAYGFLHINVNGTEMRLPLFSPTQAGG